MGKLLTLLTLLPLFCAGQALNYLDYHAQILQAEEYMQAILIKNQICVYR
jgi:hypothetical protein